ncbi:cation transporter [Streptomyces sp. ISL-100]|nr:cation transporter [Streptomyces sp. ISL-100]
MHCNSCGLLIDDELEDLAGVRSSSTDVRAERTFVRLEEGADVDTAALIAAVEQAGDYTARPAD